MSENNNKHIEEQGAQQPSQDASFDPVMQKIIEEETGIDLTPKSDGEAQQVSQDPPEKDGESEEDYSITQEQLDEFKGLGYEETDLDNIKPDELKSILETKTAKPQAAEPQTPLITPEMAEKYGGIVKSFVGKPIDDVLIAVQKNNQRIGDLEKQLKQHATTLTKQENEKVDELLKELKTSAVLSEEDFWKKFDEVIELKTKANLQAEANKPQQEAEALAFMQSAMPEGTDFNTSFAQWSQSLKPEELQYYKGTNDYVIRDAVKNFVLLQQKEQAIATEQQRLKDLEAKRESDAKILAAKKTAQAIKNANGKNIAGSKYHVIERTKPGNADFSGVDPIVAEIIKNELER